MGVYACAGCEYDNAVTSWATKQRVRCVVDVEQTLLRKHTTVPMSLFLARLNVSGVRGWVFVSQSDVNAHTDALPPTMAAGDVSVVDQLRATDLVGSAWLPASSEEARSSTSGEGAPGLATGGDTRCPSQATGQTETRSAMEADDAVEEESVCSCARHQQPSQYRAHVVCGVSRHEPRQSSLVHDERGVLAVWERMALQVSSVVGVDVEVAKMMLVRWTDCSPCSVLDITMPP